MLEATGNALAIARILKPHVAEVVLAHAKQVRAISHARIKTDKVDAKVLADLLAADLIPAVRGSATSACGCCAGWCRAAVGWSSAAPRSRTRSLAALHRNLKGRNPASDPFGKKGRGVDRRAAVADRRAPDRRWRPAPAGLLRRRAGPDRRDHRSAGARRRGYVVAGDDPRRRRRDRRHAGRRDRRRPALPEHAASGRLPRAAPDDPPVRQRAGRATAVLSKEGSGCRPPRAVSKPPGRPPRQPGPLRAGEFGGQERHLRIRARGAPGQVAGAASYTSGLTAHKSFGLPDRVLPEPLSRKRRESTIPARTIPAILRRSFSCRYTTSLDLTAAGYNRCLHSRWTATSAKTSRMNFAPPLLWAEVARNGAEPATAGLGDERDQVPRPPMSVVAVPRDSPECGGTHRKVPARLSAAVRSCPGFARGNCLRGLFGLPCPRALSDGEGGIRTLERG